MKAKKFNSEKMLGNNVEGRPQEGEQIEKERENW